MPSLHLLCHSFYSLFMCMKRQFCCLSCLWHSLCQVQAWTVLCITGVSCSIMLLFSGLFLVLRMNSVTDFCVFKSMWPLLKRDGLGVQYIATLILWNWLLGFNPLKLHSKMFVQLISMVRLLLNFHKRWLQLLLFYREYTLQQHYYMFWSFLSTHPHIIQIFSQFSMSWSAHPSLCLFGYGASNVALRYNGHLGDWAGMVLVH